MNAMPFFLYCLLAWHYFVTYFAPSKFITTMGSEDIENGVDRAERRSSLTEKRRRRRKRRPPSDQQVLGFLQLPAYTNGHILFFLFSALLFIAVTTNFVLFAYLPDHLASETGWDYVDDANGEGQKEILRVLEQAGVTVDDATLATLPNWSDITSMYGPKPIIYGLDTCAKFQSTFKPEERFIGPAGIFNTGTNLLAKLLKDNCEIPGAAPEHPYTRDKMAPGMRFQVPWGKHNL